MRSELLSGLPLSSVPGCCIAVLTGEAHHEFFFHGRCFDGGPQISPQTLWEAASLSKPVVALLALEGEISDPGFLALPLQTGPGAFGASADERWSQLTLWHLLTHTAGLPNWRDEGEALSFESDPGAPGYSGEGFELLLVELAARAGVPAATLLVEQLRRWDMPSSSFTPHLTDRADVAVGHDESGRPLPKTRPTVPKGSGSLHTTAGDYLRFLACIADPPRIADPVQRRAATRMAEREVEILEGHGRTPGWAFTETDSGDVLWQHGDNAGFKHVAAVRPSTGEVVLVLTNGDMGQTLYREVCKRVLDVDVW